MNFFFMLLQVLNFDMSFFFYIQKIIAQKMDTPVRFIFRAGIMQFFYVKLSPTKKDRDDQRIFFLCTAPYKKKYTKMTDGIDIYARKSRSSAKKIRLLMASRQPRQSNLDHLDQTKKNQMYYVHF